MLDIKKKSPVAGVPAREIYYAAVLWLERFPADPERVRSAVTAALKLQGPAMLYQLNCNGLQVPAFRTFGSHAEGLLRFFLKALTEILDNGGPAAALAQIREFEAGHGERQK